MSFTTEAAAMAEASRMVHEIADSVKGEYDRVDAQVSGLLGGGWSGVAADQYRQAWRDWCEGMQEILSALHTEAELISASQAAYTDSDTDSTDRMTPFGSRLSTRLG